MPHFSFIKRMIPIIKFMYGFLPQPRKLKQTAGNMYQISRKPGDHTLTGNDHCSPLTAKLTFDRCNRCNTRCKAGRKQEGPLLKVVSELPAGRRLSQIIWTAWQQHFPLP